MIKLLDDLAYIKNNDILKEVLTTILYLIKYRENE